MNDEAETGTRWTPSDDCPAGCELAPQTGKNRAAAARDLRISAAQEQYDLRFGSGGTAPAHACNGDEVRYGDRNFIGSFTKGLPHFEDTGEVRPEAYCALLRAVKSGKPDDFENVPLGCPDPNAQRKLENPQAGYTFELQGGDPASFEMPPAPQFESQDEAADVLENYWMALARDIPFTDYSSSGTPADALLDAAFKDLKRFTFYGPQNSFYRTTLSRDNLFRGFAKGDEVGPYLSQFLLMDVPYGSQVIPARIRTVLPGIDYMTSFGTWLSVQQGCDASQQGCDPVPRYIRNGRDLGQFVHLDQDFTAHYNACWILTSGRDPLRRCEAAAGQAVEFAKGLPYVNPVTPREEQFPTKSKTQIGVGTFGPPHVKSVLLEAVGRALRAVWYQKWQVHRRLRPEEFGGRVHLQITGKKNYPIHPSISTSPLFAEENKAYSIFRHNHLQNCNRRRDPPEQAGTYLLPMAFAEGSPLHPSYGAGHATVAGACVTILKAFFAEEQCIPNPMVPNREGTALLPYEDSGRDKITIGGELNKLASNIALGRNFAGVHWRSDYTESVRLGERVAISLLFDQRRSYNESYFFKFHRLDGAPIHMDKNSTVNDLRNWLKN